MGNYYNSNTRALSPTRKIRPSIGANKAKSMRNIGKNKPITSGTPGRNMKMSIVGNGDLFRTDMMSQTYNPVEYAKQANLKYVGSN